MRIGIDYGLERAEIEVADERLIPVQREPLAPDLSDPAAAAREALEHPFGFPALRRALTPDDHVTVVVDEHLPRLPQLLNPLLEHLASANVSADAITLVTQSASSAHSWRDELSNRFQDVRVEAHNPAERRTLSYLATTRQGRRLYLNRSVVDADQLVVLSGRGYDSLLGLSGAEGAIYPVLSDAETRKELSSKLSLAAPGKTPWPVRREATEVAWLLGAPFFVQVIEGNGDAVAHILAGLSDASIEAERLHDARWRIEADRPADTVVVSVSGNPKRHGFADLARAAACAARIVKPQGHIVILSQVGGALGEDMELLRHEEDAKKAWEHVRRHGPADREAAFLWASAAQRAKIYLLSALPAETVEELFAVPLDEASQVQRLLGGSCLVLPDGHKTMAELRAT